MAVAREKQRTHRKKKLEGMKTKTSVILVEPISADIQEPEKTPQKIKVPTKARSALIQGEGRSMDMDID